MEKKYVNIAQTVIKTDDVEKLSQEACECLSCGDVVVKVTVEGGKVLEHTYQVTHKQATGLCFSYFAAGYLETISYDKIDGVWTFNSKDVWQAEQVAKIRGIEIYAPLTLKEDN